MTRGFDFWETTKTFPGSKTQCLRYATPVFVRVCVCVCVCVCVGRGGATTWFFPSLVVMCRNWTLERHDSRAHWPSSLRRRSTVVRLQRLWARNPPRAWMPLCCECCMLSGTGLGLGMMTHIEESYRLWCVVVCGLQNFWMSWMRRLWPTGGILHQKQRSNKIFSWGLFVITRCFWLFAV